MSTTDQGARNGQVPAPPGGPAGSAAVQITDVTKEFGRGKSATVALDRVSLSVAPGEFVCLIGASGCGKSTLLSLVAGLEAPTSGTVATGGRRVALMFQEPALFPWFTAAQNVGLPLRANGVARSARRQRVALARALAQDADVLLMDEPFGALDAMTRDLLHELLEGIWRRQGFSVLFVTHEVREAVRLGDRVVLLSSRPGRVLEDFGIDIERPRGIDSGATVERAMQIKERLNEEVMRHVS